MSALTVGVASPPPGAARRIMFGALLVAVSAGGIAAGTPADLRVGRAKVVITPPIGSVIGNSSGIAIATGVTSDLHAKAIAFGRDLALVGYPGDSFGELGLRMKQNSPYARTFVSEQAGSGSLGYVPNEKAYPEGSYEVESARLAPGGGEVLADGAIRLLTELFHQPAADLGRPHIVLVMADDMGWGETGYYNHPVLKTPQLDAMAAGGLRFDRFYAGAPVCSPTRATVLAGRSNDRAGKDYPEGIVDPADLKKPRGWTAIPEYQPHLERLLRRPEYRRTAGQMKQP